MLFLFYILLPAISLATQPNCPLQNGAYIPDSDCGRFWQCSNGVAHLFNCTVGLHFNPTINVCDWPDSAGCTSTSTKAPSTSSDFITTLQTTSAITSTNPATTTRRTSTAHTTSNTSSTSTSTTTSFRSTTATSTLSSTSTTTTTPSKTSTASMSTPTEILRPEPASSTSSVTSVTDIPASRSSTSIKTTDAFTSTNPPATDAGTEYEESTSVSEQQGTDYSPTFGDTTFSSSTVTTSFRSTNATTTSAATKYPTASSTSSTSIVSTSTPTEFPAMDVASSASAVTSATDIPASRSSTSIKTTDVFTSSSTPTTEASTEYEESTSVPEQQSTDYSPADTTVIGDRTEGVEYISTTEDYTDGDCGSSSSTRTSTTEADIESVEYICQNLRDDYFLAPHPRTCSLYVVCNFGITHVMNCPPGLWFNTQYQTCVGPASSDCRLHASTHSDQAAVAKDPLVHVCEIYEIAFLSDPRNCSGFIVCVRGHPRFLSCPSGLSFDSISRECVHPDDTKCFADHV